MTSKPRPRPCSTCPYRLDVPSGIWSADEYDKLPRYDGDIPDQVLTGATGLFYCHQQTGDLCAGWAGCHDMVNNLAVRLNRREVDPSTYDYVSPVPLFASGAQAAEHGRRDVADPGPDARAKARSLTRLAARRAREVTGGE